MEVLLLLDFHSLQGSETIVLRRKCAEKKLFYIDCGEEEETEK